jgi:hypothetical protein
MKSTVRLVSILRWMAVAMHTAFVVSTSVSVASRIEPMWSHITAAFMMLIDLPVTLLTVVPVNVLKVATPSPAISAVLFPTIFVVLGGLQWYLIASLLARWTCGFERTMLVASKRFTIVLLLSLFLVSGCGVIPWAARLQRLCQQHFGDPYTPPPKAFTGRSEQLRQTVVVPTLDTPLPKVKNAIWCGTLQIAWERLGKDVIHESPNVQNAEVVVSRLNLAKFSEDDLPPDSYLAVAGFAKNGVVEKIKSGMKQTFHKEVQIDLMEPNDILAYAYLEANAVFTVPFFDNREPFHFRDSSEKNTEVTSFGIQAKHEYAYDDLREQVEVLYLRRPHDERKYETPEEFVIDLCRTSSPNQVIIASVSSRTTLAETLDDVEGKIKSYRKEHPEEHWRRFGIRDVLLVPNLNWEIQHHFTELEGTDKRFLNTGFTDYHIAKAIQTIRFKLDRSGAELAAEAQLFCKPMATYFVCDHPFYVIIKKRGVTRPFFVMRVDNAELLCKPQH